MRGIVQFVIQDDFGLQYLGESQLDTNSSGVAKFAFGADKLIRAYGPYAHSNPYSGVMVLDLILTVIWRRLLGPLFLVIAGYPLALEGYLDSRSIAHDQWQIDYVHSVPLLLLREWGVIGLLGLLIVLTPSAIKARANLVWLIPIVPLLLFDHYFATQYGPLILLVGFVYLILHSEIPHSELESLGRQTKRSDQ